MRLCVRTIHAITYPEENFKYYNAYSNPRKRLTKLLLGSSRGYCMYCGKKLTVESDENFHIEHSVDKDGNIHQEVDKTGALKHCKFNLSISCPECNLVCKKAVDKIDLSKYAPIEKCLKKCTRICDKYRDIRGEYIKKNAIILQPLGIEELGKRAIVYNLAKHIYEANDEIIDEANIFLIQNHIDRFRLNSDRFSPSIIVLCVKIVGMIEAGVKDINKIFEQLSLEQPENIIGLEFINHLKDTFQASSCEQLDKYCRMLVLLDAVY